MGMRDKQSYRFTNAVVGFVGGSRALSGDVANDFGKILFGKRAPLDSHLSASERRCDQ